MPDRQNILIVDDSPSDIQFLLTNLKDDFRITVAKSGESALEKFMDSMPDIVLMDVSMPGMDGYEACRKIKSAKDSGDPEVIFVSANDTVDEKLKGYEAGGSDYLIKPVEPHELLQKVKVVMRNAELRKAAELERRSAFDTAMVALTESGEQGLVLDFLRRSFGVVNVKGLAEQVVQAVGKFGLACSAQLRHGGFIINESNTPPVPPLEIELMTRLKDSGRIHHKNQRLIINFDHITMLVKNMPKDDAQCGRIRDHLALIAEAADAQIPSLSLSDNLHHLVEHSNLALKGIKERQIVLKQKNVEIIDGMTAEIEEAFTTFGLTETQENDLLAIVKRAVDKTLDNFEKGLKVDAEMERIVLQIQNTLRSQYQSKRSL